MKKEGKSVNEALVGTIHALKMTIQITDANGAKKKRTGVETSDTGNISVVDDNDEKARNEHKIKRKTPL